MATELTLTEVIGPVETPAGLKPLNGRVHWRLPRADGEGATVVGPVVQEVLLDAEGQFTKSLWCTSEGDLGLTYAVSITWWDEVMGRMQSAHLGYMALSYSATAQALKDLLVPEMPAIVPTDILAAAAAYASAAEASAAGALTSATGAAASASAAATSATNAALYDGPKVNLFSELAGVVAAQVPVGGLIRVIETDQVFRRAANAASDAQLDYTGSGGLKWYSLQARTVQAATVAAALPAGTVSWMDGLPYISDPAATGAQSCTNDLGVNGLRPYGMVWLRHFASGMVEDSTDIAPIVLRAIVATQGVEDIHLPRGTWRWTTAITIDPSTLAVSAIAAYFVAPRLVGAGPDATRIKSNVNGWMLQVLRPWASMAPLAKCIATGLRIEGMSFSVFGTPATPRGIRLMAQYDGEIKHVKMIGFAEGIRFDADDPGGDQQSSAHMMLSFLSISPATGGDGIVLAASATGAVSVAYFTCFELRVGGGARGAVISGCDQLYFQDCGFTSQTVANMDFPYNGIANRNFNMDGGELGNNATGTPFMVRAQSLDGCRFKNVRLVRGPSEVGAAGYYLQAVAGGSFIDVVFEDDDVTIQGAGAFLINQADSGAICNGVRVVNRRIKAHPGGAQLDPPDKYGPKRQTYSSTGGATVDLLIAGEAEHIVSMSSTAAISRNFNAAVNNDDFILTIINTGGGSITPALSSFTTNSPAVPTMAAGAKVQARCRVDTATNKVDVYTTWRVIA